MRERFFHCGVDPFEGYCLAGRDAQLLEHLGLTDDVAATFAEFLAGLDITVLRLLNALAHPLQIGYETDQLVVKLGAAI